jgi:hypothetical protein
MSECIKCGIIKTPENTSPHPNTADRMQRYCKKCYREVSREWYRKNKKEAQEKREKWQEENRSIHNTHARKYQKKKRDERQKTPGQKGY